MTLRAVANFKKWIGRAVIFAFALSLEIAHPLFAASCGNFSPTEAWSQELSGYVERLKENERKELEWVGKAASAAEACDYVTLGLSQHEFSKASMDTVYTYWFLLFSRDDLVGDLFWLAYSLPPSLFQEAYQNVFLKAFQAWQGSFYDYNPQDAGRVVGNVEEVSANLRRFRDKAKNYRPDWWKKEDPKTKNMLFQSYDPILPTASRRFFKDAKSQDEILGVVGEMEVRINQFCFLTNAYLGRHLHPEIHDARMRLEKAEATLTERCRESGSPPAAEEVTS